jgi:hypothetical protein
MIDISFSYADPSQFEGLVFLDDIGYQVGSMVVNLFYLCLQFLDSGHIGEVFFVVVDEEGQLGLSEVFPEEKFVFAEIVREDFDIVETFEFGLILD